MFEVRLAVDALASASWEKGPQVDRVGLMTPCNTAFEVFKSESIIEDAIAAVAFFFARTLRCPSAAAFVDQMVWGKESTGRCWAEECAECAELRVDPSTFQNTA